MGDIHLSSFFSSGHMRRKRSSGESFEDFEETNLEKRSSGGSSRSPSFYSFPNNILILDTKKSKIQKSNLH